jgi:flagellar FliL protein
MPGEYPHDLEFVEAGRESAARVKDFRARLVWPASLLLLAIAIGVGFVALTARDRPHVAAAVPPPAAIFLDLPAMKTNLAASEPRTLMLSLSLEAADRDAAGAVQAALPYLFDAFQTHLRELRPVELEGAAGLFRLREELMKRANLAIAPQRVRAVLVREMLVQ